ncbi:hypothetical protein CRUP_007901, partial [Coryphaenoides rupestris]
RPPPHAPPPSTPLPSPSPSPLRRARALRFVTELRRVHKDVTLPTMSTSTFHLSLRPPDYGGRDRVPERFLEVAQITLREFFNAIVAGKDVDPSWKKAIYKVICKLDSEVPEVFKSPNCLQELLHE